VIPGHIIVAVYVDAYWVMNRWFITMTAIVVWSVFMDIVVLLDWYSTPTLNLRTPIMTPENLRRIGIIMAVLVIVYGGLKMVGIIPSG